jgi:hypothetical protein
MRNVMHRRAFLSAAAAGLLLVAGCADGQAPSERNDPAPPGAQTPPPGVNDQPGNGTGGAGGGSAGNGGSHGGGGRGR